MADPTFENRLSQLETKLLSVEQRMEDLLSEIRRDMSEIKAATSHITALVVRQDQYKEDLHRAFRRIEDLEKFETRTDAYVNKVEGAKQLAWVLWGLLSSGLAIALFKLFFG